MNAADGYHAPVLVRITFRPDDGPTQILTANMTSAELDAVREIIAAPDAADHFLTIPSRVSPGGPVRAWLFRASRISVESHAEVMGRLLAEVRATLADEWGDCRAALERVESELSQMSEDEQ